MIKNITITNYLGESITLDMLEPEKSGFAIKNITGLGPVKADINRTNLATMDGSNYNSARALERNIVMKLEFVGTPTESIEDIRQKSYKYFPIKKVLNFRIETDNRVCDAIGYVESNAPDMFAEKSGCQISIVCPDPYFYSIDIETTVFYGIEAQFEFPFCNDSLTENLIEIGSIQNKTENFVTYHGDSEIGITIIIHAVGNVSMITIWNLTTRESMIIDTVKLEALTGSGLIAGDEIIINTNRGAKNITLLRNGLYTNILNCLTRGGSWFILGKGDNIFAYVAETGSTNLQFRILNRIIYEGV